MGNIVHAQGLNGTDTIPVEDVQEAVNEQLQQLAHDGKISRDELLRVLGSVATGKPKASLQRRTSFSARQLKDVLAMHGLLPDDCRIRDIIKTFEEGDGVVTMEDFEHIREHSVLISRALSGQLVVADFEELRDDIDVLYETVRPIRSGANADYIPQLSEKFVDPELFGISVCTIDGQRYNVGDTDCRFGVQSCSKAVSYCIAQSLHGVTEVHRHVGMEPSGRSFNEMCLDERGYESDQRKMKKMTPEQRANFKPRTKVPHNPMINAGAIMISSMLFHDLPLADRFRKIFNVWSDLCGCDSKTPAGQRPSFANSMYLSEAATADRNFCLGYMMQEAGAFLPGTNLRETLNLYFMICSIEVSAQMMSVVAATLANGGVNPMTGKRVFEQHHVRNCLSLMASCGMYDYSGEFAFTMGFPAKSGVGGGILIVIPGLMGICTFSPRLDGIGNSVRGVAVCHGLAQKFSFHNYDSLVRGKKKNPAAKSDRGSSDERSRALMWAASENDGTRAMQLILSILDINASDYDGRTAIHVAASSGHLEMVKYLVANGANVDVCDRFGNTPLDDAKRENFKEIVSYLSKRKGSKSLAGKHAGIVALGSSDGRTIATERVLQLIEEVGVERTDNRVVEALKEYPQILNSAGFESIYTGSSVIRKCLCGEVALHDFDKVRDQFTDLYNQVKATKSGIESDLTFMPKLGSHDRDKWGVAVCSIDGQRILLGDVHEPFDVQACSKAITYLIALEEKGYAKVNKHIGREPSGRPVNELILDRRTDPAVPHNPFVNAGSIMSCALVQPQLGNAEARVQYCIGQYWNRLSGNRRAWTWDRDNYEMESATADRNRCLMYMMAEAGSYPEEIRTTQDLLENLEFYLMCCSIQQDADALSIVAGTLANGGVCPVSGERIFKENTVRDCLSLMYSCGMYDYSGEFAFKIGFPSKSGATGAMLIVIPNRMGICTWSPPLDRSGNSVRGLKFCALMSKAFNFHIYDAALPSATSKMDPTFHKGGDYETHIGILIEAASKGDVRTVKLWYNLNGPTFVNGGDYDARTALHLACEEGHSGVVRYLLAQEGIELEPMDRWKLTPLNYARKAGHGKIVKMLESAIAARGQQQQQHGPKSDTKKSIL